MFHTLERSTAVILALALSLALAGPPLGDSLPSANLLAAWLADGQVLDPDGKLLPPSPRPTAISTVHDGEPLQLQ